MTTGGNLTAKDLLQESRARAVHPVGQPGPPVDPVDRAMTDKRKVMAGKIYDGSIAAMEAETLEAENKGLRAKRENAELRKQTEGTGEGGGWQAFIIEELRTTREQGGRYQESLSEAQQALLNQRLEMLQGELARLQQPREQPAPEDPLTMALTTLDNAERLVEKIHPPASAPVAADPMARVIELREETNRELALKRAEWEHEAHMKALDNDRWYKEQDLALRKDQLTRMDRAVNDTIPRVVTIIQEGLDTYRGAREPTPDARPQAEPSATAGGPARVANLPEGVVAQQCSCGAWCYFRKEWRGEFPCHACGAVYVLDALEPVAAEQPQEAPA